VEHDSVTSQASAPHVGRSCRGVRPWVSATSRIKTPKSWHRSCGRWTRRQAMRRRLLIVLFLLVGVAIAIQAVPYGRHHGNPPVLAEPSWDSPQTRVLTARACFDCHSNATVWPWYSNIAPISWLVQHDVDEGRRAVNFSGGTGRRRKRANRRTPCAKARCLRGSTRSAVRRRGYRRPRRRRSCAASRPRSQRGRAQSAVARRAIGVRGSLPRALPRQAQGASSSLARVCPRRCRWRDGGSPVHRHSDPS